MKELNQEDSETYLKIVQGGNMDDMFDFGRIIGQTEILADQIEKIKSSVDNRRCEVKTPVESPEGDTYMFRCGVRLPCPDHQNLSDEVIVRSGKSNK